MLIIVEYLGRILLCILLGSWTAAALPRARDFILFAGGLVFGVAVGTVLYLVGKFDSSYQVERLSAFVWLPLIVIVFIFVIEAIKKEIEKKDKQTT